MVNKLKWSLVLLTLALVSTSANAFNQSIKAGSINMAQNPWYDPDTTPTPTPTSDYMQAHMINVDGVEEFTYLANGDVKVRALKSNGDVGRALVIGRDVLFKVNFAATQAGMEISRLKAWVTVYNNTNATAGQSLLLAGPSGTTPMVEFPTSYDPATAPTYEDSHTVVIPGNLVQAGLRWTLNWYVFGSEPDASGKSPILSAHHIDSKEQSVSKFDAYTPGPSDWLVHATKPFENTNHTSHEPDGVYGVDWPSTTWDGTIYNPALMTPADFYSGMCPNGVVRGMRELFYQHNPFSDVNNPAKGEVDEWHRLLINHIRTLVGLPMPQYEIKKDYCTFAESRWFDERKHTTGWDTKYSEGDTCQVSPGSHCGFTFIPGAEDQGPYLPAGYPSCGPGFSGSEGMLGASPSAPWSTKFSGSFCGVLNNEGYWGGHVGPFWGRTKFGFSFWPTGGVRANWTGTGLPQLYCNPNDPENFPGCDPNNTGP